MQIGIAVLMVITGSINTLAGSWADNTYAVGTDGISRPFDHPFFQAVAMFLGEMLCLFAYLSLHFYKKRERKKLLSREGEENIMPAKKKRFNPLIFLPPACCDMIGTSLMYVGLTMTYASSYQMLRGALIIFTGFLSVAFLGRTLRAYQWTGMFIVLAGLAVVGASDFIFMDDDDDHNINDVITGDLLIIIAQVVVATQMVLEEKFIGKNDVHPLAAVGCEGTFGFFILGILLIPMYFIHTNQNFSDTPEYRLEDALDAFYQMGQSWEITLALVGSVISIAFFNFAGVSVTKEINATTRTVLDSIRTLIVWMVSLGVGWEKFNYLQVVGFIVLIVGMFVYNDILFTPFMRQRGWLPCAVCDPPVEDPHEEVSVIKNENGELDINNDTGLDNPVAALEEKY